MDGVLGKEIPKVIYTQPNLTGGIDSAIVTTAQSVPAFPIMILLFVYFLVLIGGSSNQKRRTGNADFPFWATLGGLTVTFLSLIFTLVSGIISGVTLGIVIAVTILSAIWFFLSKVRGES